MERKISFREQFLAIINNKKVMVSLFTTFLVLIVFRIGATIPMPFAKVSGELVGDGDSFLGMMNLLGGGGLSQFSIFAIGVSPYITAQIIVQLLSSDLIPPLSKLQKSGERGRRKIEVITRLLTLPFSVIQSYAIITLVVSNGGLLEFSFPTASGTIVNELGAFQYFFYVTLMTAGTYFVIFLGDIITKRGIGNGITLIIFAGIVANLISNFTSVYSALTTANGQSVNLTNIISFMLYVAFYVLMLIGIVFIQGSTRKIPVQQIGQGLIQDEKELPFLPIKINSAGVIPVIFASSVMTIPSTIAQFLPENNGFVIFTQNYLELTTLVGILIFIFMILFFTFFYSYIQLNPQQISDNFRKSGKFIPGIKVGMDTEKHITKTLFRINCIGAPFLAAITSAPYFISYALDGLISANATLGGTGILIMVTTSIEFWQAVRSASTTTSYVYTKKEMESQISNVSLRTQDEMIELW